MFINIQQLHEMMEQGRQCINITKDVIVSPSPYASKEDWEIYNKKIEAMTPKEEVKVEVPVSTDKQGESTASNQS